MSTWKNEENVVAAATTPTITTAVTMTTTCNTNTITTQVSEKQLSFFSYLEMHLKADAFKCSS